MRTLIPSLLVLAAGCTPPPPDLSAVTKELAVLRQGLEDVRKDLQPTFDKEQALADLTKEVRRPRTAPEPPPAPAAAPAAPKAPLQAGALAGGVGGTQSGINDLYWVLTKLQVDNEDRVVLALYQAQQNRGFKLVGVRTIGADLQIVEFGGDKPHVRDIVEELKKAKK